jgi:tetratricopeptide (TPR) repeat protein
VRYAALELLKQLASDEAVSIVGALLQSAHDDELEAVVMSLAEIGTPSAVAQLRQFRDRAVQDGRPKQVVVVQQGLEHWKSRRPGARYLSTGHSFFSNHEHAEAIKMYSRAILIDPELAEAYSFRGNVYLHSNEFEKARHDFEQAVQLDPSDGQGITGAGVVWAIAGDWQKAIDYVEQQSAKFPRDDTYHYNTACVYGRAVEFLQKQPPGEERDKKISELQALGVSQLEESIRLGFRDLGWMQKDPDLAPLRDLPGFQKLIRKN